MPVVDLSWMLWLTREEFALVAATWFTREYRGEVEHADVDDGMKKAAVHLRRAEHYRFKGIEIDEEDEPHKKSPIPAEPGNRLHLEALLEHGRSFDWKWMFKTAIEVAESRQELQRILPAFRSTQERVLAMRGQVIEERTPEEEQAMREMLEAANYQVAMAAKPEEVN